MSSIHRAAFGRNWKEIAAGFLKLGATAYGGPAIMGLMQIEFQDKRQWVPFALWVPFPVVAPPVQAAALAAMRGVGPAVMGVLAMFLVRMAPHALPDPVAVVMLIVTLIALLAWRIGAMKLMGTGAIFGALRSRLFPLPGVRAIL